MKTEKGKCNNTVRNATMSQEIGKGSNFKFPYFLNKPHHPDSISLILHQFRIHLHLSLRNGKNQTWITKR